ncbi:MAG: hypothetical protein ABR905_15780 [Terracidiphilus sp.]
MIVLAEPPKTLGSPDQMASMLLAAPFDRRRAMPVVARARQLVRMAAVEHLAPRAKKELLEPEKD